MSSGNLCAPVHVISDKIDVLSLMDQLIDTYKPEDPFMICDIGEIIKKIQIWNQALKRVIPHYAVKCNDNKRVLETLAAQGFSFDCASKNEIDKILAMGVYPNQIIFAHATKPTSHIAHARKVGISKMTFDNEPELHKIKEVYPDAELVLRFRCDDLDAELPLGIKFGCDPIADAPELLKTARELNLNVIGICFHVGSNSTNANIFISALRLAKKIFDFGKTIGYNFHLLDIGGGFPGTRNTSIDKFAEVINFGLKEYFPDPHVTVIAEPGRYFVASSCTLAANIHSMRPIVEKYNSGTITKSNMYYLNDGSYGSFAIYIRQHTKILFEPLKQNKNTSLIKSTVWGPTCDSTDKILDNVLLPQMKIGDWLVFHDMGAYTLPGACNFNNFQPPNVYVVAKESIWEILKDSKPFNKDDFTSSQVILNK